MMLKQEEDDFVKASVAKTKPAQDVGLSLEERDRRIYITKVEGLFKGSVEAGDELLEVNGTEVTDKELFPSGLEDIKKFIKGEWNVFIQVKKGASNFKKEERNDVCPTFSRAVATFAGSSNQSRNPVSDSEDSTLHSDEDQGTLPLKVEASPEPPKKTRRRSKSPHGSKSRQRSKSTDSKKSRSRSKSRRRSKSPHGSKSRSKSKSTKSRRTRKPVKDDSESERTETTVSISMHDSDSGGFPLTPHKPSSDLTIKSVRGDRTAITVEMGNGRSICVTPQQLMQVVSDDDLPVDTRNRGDLRKNLVRETKSKFLVGSEEPATSDVKDSKEGNMDSSTHSCMTNLIDPGDLMKIRGFTVNPDMNGLTVEVIRRTKGTKGKRWDVRVINTKKKVEITTKFNPKSLISIGRGHLVHFV